MRRAMVIVMMAAGTASAAPWSFDPPAGWHRDPELENQIHRGMSTAADVAVWHGATRSAIAGVVFVIGPTIGSGVRATFEETEDATFEATRSDGHVVAHERAYAGRTLVSDVEVELASGTHVATRTIIAMTEDRVLVSVQARCDGRSIAACRAALPSLRLGAGNLLDLDDEGSDRAGLRVARAAGGIGAGVLVAALLVRRRRRR
jgi:hypothetical protein